MRSRTIGFGAGFGRRAGMAALVVVSATGLLAAAPARVGAQSGIGSAAVGHRPAGSTAPPRRVARALQRRIPEVDLDHVVVRFRSRPADLPSRIARAGAAVDRAVPGTSWTELATPNHSARRVRAALLRDPAVAEVALSYIRHASTLPNDPLWTSAQSSYLAPLKLDRAWDLSKGGGVTVAVVDTGTDLGHPDLAGQLVGGFNALNPGAPPQDDNGHGTMVSGIVAARTNNNRGVVAMAPNAKVMPVKVLDSTGSGTDSDIATGITWARTHGAKVINLSLGGSFDDPMLAQAVHNAILANVVVVAAAGNDSAETVEFPAADPGVLAVSATDHFGALTSFSSFGWRVDVAAPGLDVTSTTLGGGYATESGTSFSSPIVAGVAALIRAKQPTWTQAQVTARIRSTARDAGVPGVDAAFGHGLVSPLAALGGPPAAPHPSSRVGADEPNDTPTDATPLAVGASHSAQIAPETDDDWYAVNFAAATWYTIHVPSSASSFEHEMDPIVELYKPDHSFTASQELAGGDLIFKITAPGPYFVRVRNMNASTAAYAISVHASAAPPTFASSLDVDFGTNASSVGIGDVNGDGRNDLLVAFGSASLFPDTIVVFTQTASRSLTLFAALPTHDMTGGGLATGDLNGDGNSDIAIPVTGGIDYFTNLSASSVPSFASRPGTSSVAIADVDGDTNNDIVAAGSFGARVFWGPPFGGPSSTSVTTIASSRSVAAGNVSNHGDGLLDVVTCCVNVFVQTSARTFAADIAYPLASGGDVAIGDIDQNTSTDIASTLHAVSGRVYRLVQNGSGGLTVSSNLTAAARPQPVVVNDVNGDGANDIVVLHDFAAGSSSVAAVGWFRQTATHGVFAAEQTFPIGDFTKNYDSRALAVGDIEGDGRADVVVATSSGISILLQNSGVLPTLGGAWVVDAQPSALATNVPNSVAPTVTFGRDVTNANGTTVQLRDAHGDGVAATISYDGPSRTATVTPGALLPVGQYSVHLAGLSDGSETLADAATSFTVGAAADEVAPQTTLQSPPTGTRGVASATISFTSTDGAATFSCSFDNHPYHACVSPQQVTATPGNHAFRVFARDPAGNEDPTPAAAKWTYLPPIHGYWMLGGAGTIYRFGNAPALGNAPTSHAVDFDVSPTGHGYSIVDTSGRVFAFGDTIAHGNAPALAAGDSVTSISQTASGHGYWLFTARGRVYPFGDAHFYGDLRNTHLNGPVLDSVRTPSGHGYYMVGSDGGVFSFGDARFHGSTGAMRLHAPVRSIVPDPDGAGYWLVAVDGGVFAFDAPFRGSMGATKLNRPIVGMVAFGNGYLMVGSDGGIFDFSTKKFLGSLGGHPPAIPIVSVAAFG